jgi:glycosyltransferase involved in cell wall biosynthesis
MVDVSIVVAVYNAEEYIENCLDMLSKQSLENIEIICVDDGSKDNSLDIIKEYSKKDSRIKVVSESNGGAGAARNRGMKEATGKYILFLDCDDFFEPDMVEKAFRKAEEDNAEIVIYKSDQYNMDTQEYVYEDWAMIEWALPPYEPFSYRQISTNIFRAFVGWAWDKLYLREFVLENNLEFQQQRTTNDALFVFSALVLAKRISTVREILIHRRVDTEDSLSKTRDKSWDNFYKMLLALRDVLKNHGRYEELEKDYINYALHFSLWHYNTLAEPTKTKLRQALLGGWFDELGVTGKDKDYFYDQYEYSQYELMQHNEENESLVSGTE